MNRRTFARGMVGAACVAAAGRAAAATEPAHAAVAAPAAPSVTTADGGSAPFSLSVMLWTVFTGLPFEERLAKVAEAGYSNIELVGEYNKWAPEDFDKANAARKRLNLQFDTTAGIRHGLADPSDRDALLNSLKQALDPMQKLAIPSMILLSGNVVPGLSREAQHQSCIDGLKRAAELIDGKTIDGKPVKLLLECIDPEENPKYFLQSAAEGIEVVRAVNHPQVRFLYDLFHEQIAEGNLIEKLDKHIDVIDLLHIADVPGRHEPGTGEINYANIYRKLAQLNYRGMVAMEFKPLGDQVEALRAARKMALDSARA